jgi:hypothetical protein
MKFKNSLVPRIDKELGSIPGYFVSYICFIQPHEAAIHTFYFLIL